MANDIEKVEYLNYSYKKVLNEIGKVIVGQQKIIEHIFIALLSKGHCLLVGVPGLAKTLLIKTVAEVLDLKFSRIQFTPDLMPSDITGTEIIESMTSGEKSFKFLKGPIFANIILADEINRTPPKTQSALLESMQEHSVTAAGQTYKLEEPFFVLATQNPIEQEGTYPLPEAQLDRFMFNLWIDYPSESEEKQIVKSTTSISHIKLEKTLSAKHILEFQDLVKRVPVADNVIEYVVNIVSKTRPQNNSSSKFVNSYLRWGAGPRASQYIIFAAKSKAILNGKTTPSIEDVRDVLVPILRHRIVLNFNAEAEGISATTVIEKILAEK